MLSADQPRKHEAKNAELTARLAVRERLHYAQLTQLARHQSQLEQKAEILERENAQLKSQLSQYCETNLLLKEEIAWLKAQFYGRSSERCAADEASPDQRMLFNEAEVLAAIAAADAAAAAPIRIEAHERRQKPGRKVIPAEFPRISVVHDIAECDKHCPHDGTALIVIGKETAERYDLVRPQLRVLVDERLKYACPCCHQGVKIAPLPAQLLPKSMAAPSLLAAITTAKFVDGLPLTRQSTQFARLGLSLGAGTMGGWMNTIGAQKVSPLINLMHEAALAEPLLHCDETSVQVLKSEKAPSADHYMIVRAAGPPGRRIVLFNYEPNRNVETIKRLLTGPEGSYRGKLVVDGLQLYDYVGEALGILLCGCLAHARRGFDAAAKITESPSGQSLARVAIKDYIGKVYAVEREINAQRERRERSGGEWSLEETRQVRQEKSAPIMAAFKGWLDELSPGVPPKSALGKAIGYCFNQWDKLNRFVEHPDVPPDNNRVENAIRPFALGRRSWLFMDTQMGARASANLYSLVGSCRANGVEPHAYFDYLYTHLPEATTLEQLEALLPWNVKPLLKRSLTPKP
ncbi:MAG: IS66 family transposase [Steroidobacteraceae bacterium]